MKNISIFLLILLGMFAIVSCDKSKIDNPDNHFSYAGTNYIVDSACLIEGVLDGGTAYEMSLFQLRFLNVTETDTTYLIMTLFDTLSNTLNGNYPGIDQMDVYDVNRGIIPNQIGSSGIFLPTKKCFYTGNNGSIDISTSNNEYTIKINDLSAGIYSDVFDVNFDGNAEYTEKGKIGGFYKGNIIKYKLVFTKKNTFTKLFD